MNHDNTKSFDWKCRDSWKMSAKNTFWCLIGCAIGDNLTILYFQRFSPKVAMWLIMLLASLGGLISSISLETIIMLKQMPFKESIKTAFGMSIISMLMMETVANLTSIVLVGGNRLMLTWGSLIPSWFLGFLSAWVYNYYKLKRYGTSCH